MCVDPSARNTVALAPAKPDDNTPRRVGSAIVSQPARASADPVARPGAKDTSTLRVQVCVFS